MASQLGRSSDFAATFAIHVALKAALKARKYKENVAVRRAAVNLTADLESGRSVYGRQLKMIGQMAKGATNVEMGRKLRASRRTIFRYLNQLEDAGISIELVGSKYYVDKGVTRMLRI